MAHYSIITALWLGILTSISPCPLASNIAALSYLSGGTGRVTGRSAVLTGLYYTLGRMIAYTVLAFVITYQILSVSAAANFLQKYMSLILGPVLVLSGLVMIDFITLKIPGIAENRFVENVLKRHPGIVGSCIMGIVFALSFCPVSAAIFFGSLIPLSVENNSSLAMPLAYGAGTAAPVVGAAICIGLGVDITGRFYEATRCFGCLAQKASGTVFVIVGGYYIWTFIVPLLKPA